MTHTEAFAEHVARASARRDETAASRVTWRHVSADTGGGYSGLGPDGALVYVRELGGGDYVYGQIVGKTRVVMGTSSSLARAKRSAAALLAANGPTAADEAVNRPKEDTMARTTSTRKASPKTDQARAQREAKATGAETPKRSRRKVAQATPAPVAAPTPPETPEGASSPEGAPAMDATEFTDALLAGTPIPEDVVVKLDPPSSAERTEAATGQKPKIETAPLADALLAALREQVKKAERVDAKSGSYFRIRLEKATLGYVTASGSGLRCEIALATDRVPKEIGVEIKPGSGKLPIVVRVTDQSEAVHAGALFALAAETVS